MEQFKFREALGLLMDVARVGNKYLADTEPWKIIKTDQERVATILNLSLQIVANLSCLAAPFLPSTSEKLKKYAGRRSFYWQEAGSIDLLKAGQKLHDFELLFEKIEDDIINTQIQKLIQTRENNLNKIGR